MTISLLRSTSLLSACHFRLVATSCVLVISLTMISRCHSLLTHSGHLGGSLHEEDDACGGRASSGEARFCRPDFVNTAAARRIVASNTCGMDGPERLCSRSDYDDPQHDEGGGGVTKLGGQLECEICDNDVWGRAHPTSHLSDLHHAGNRTCWMSSRLTQQRQETTLTLSLGKKYELTYISVEFCSRVPDSLALLKSSDHGRSWQPLYYVSSQCEDVFGRSPDVVVTRANEQEPVCHQRDVGDYSTSSSSRSRNRVAFSTLQGRPSAYQLDESPVLQDWVTATDVRVLLKRLLPDGELMVDYSSSTHSLSEAQEGDPAGFGDAERIESYSASSDGAQARSLFTSGSSVSPGSLDFFAVADIAVGGRCKCNGHASRCERDSTSGRLVCVCRHNTAGRDCERCKDFHFDRPWQRANHRSANACKACNCNLHARRCRFNIELFRLSGSASGGVCSGCRHHTAGRYCHYCREGFYRDHSRPLQHRRVCKPCACHPIGAQGRTCNQTTGQCTCKDGVIGLTCNRCQRGFQQSRSPVAPCVKIPQVTETLVNYQTAHTVATVNNGKTPPKYHVSHENRCSKTCSLTTRKIGLKKMCKRNYALLMHVLDRKSAGSYWRYAVRVHRIYKNSAEARIGRGSAQLLLPVNFALCNCPRIAINRKYVLLGDAISGSSTLTIDSSSLLAEWKQNWSVRMRRLRQRARKSC